MFGHFTLHISVFYFLSHSEHLRAMGRCIVQLTVLARGKRSQNFFLACCFHQTFSGISSCLSWFQLG